MERSQFYLHTALSRQSTRLLEVEAILYGLVDLLVARGIATEEALTGAAREVRAEMDVHDDGLPVVGLRIDEEPPAAPRQVNCVERLPICKAVCCTLDFALSQRELETGRVRWDLGRPYFIRQEDDGRCCHNDRDTGGCGVYADRPLVCRQYSCEGDPRIWKDFEKMELNHEWIGAHLSQPRAPRLSMALMHRKAQIVDPSRPHLRQEPRAPRAEEPGRAADRPDGTD